MTDALTQLLSDLADAGFTPRLTAAGGAALYKRTPDAALDAALADRLAALRAELVAELVKGPLIVPEPPWRVQEEQGGGP
jgi:hypothetical protein